MRTWRAISKRSVTKLDFSREWLEARLREAIAVGTVKIGGGPLQPSVDQRIGGLGYYKHNIQIIPLWLNYAKHTWALSDVEEGMRAWLAGGAKYQAALNEAILRE